MKADESDHDILVRMDVRQATMAEDIGSLKKALYGEDGQGGVCGRVSKLENFQNTILAFVAVIAASVSFAGNWILAHLPGGGS